MHSNAIQEKDGQYIVNDSTSGGYVDRMTHSLSQNWTSVWDKDLNFVSLKNQWYELTDTLNKKDKTHEDYHKATRAKSRHLKILKDHLGIAYEIKPIKNKKTDDVIYLEKGLFTKLNDLRLGSCIIHDKTVDIGGRRFKKHELYMTPYTTEKEELMEEYNRKLKEYLEFKEFIFNQLFGSD